MQKRIAYRGKPNQKRLFVEENAWLLHLGEKSNRQSFSNTVLEVYSKLLAPYYSYS